MKGLIIASSSSSQGKTSLTLAILAWLKDNKIKCRPFKVGPDYIDVQFHKKVCGTPSINLDSYLMSSEDIQNSFSYYSHAYEYSIIEGVMGYYDGLDYSSSTYDITKILNLPVILIIHAQGTYNTIVPIIKGLIDYRKNSNIKGIILNKVSSEHHYKRLKECINSEIPEVKVLGWIKNNLDLLKSRHLGLDLQDLNNQSLEFIYSKILENIDMKELLDIANINNTSKSSSNLFTAHFALCKEANSIIDKLQNKIITIVKDNAFSFIYSHNIDFFVNTYKEVRFISALEDEVIPNGTDILYIPGGYVETADIYPKLINCKNFKSSLVDFAKNRQKRVYAECAGLMYLGRNIATVDSNNISGASLLPIDFTMSNKRNRLGYYNAIDFKNFKIYKGHCFHYSTPNHVIGESGQWGLFKEKNGIIDFGAWANADNNVLGTYLHSFFFNQPELIKNYFL